MNFFFFFFFFSSRRRHTRSDRDWSSDVCSSDLPVAGAAFGRLVRPGQTPLRQRGVRARLRVTAPNRRDAEAERAGARIGTVRSPVGGAAGADIRRVVPESACHGRPHLRRGGAIPSSGLCAVPPILISPVGAGASEGGIAGGGESPSVSAAPGNLS